MDCENPAFKMDLILLKIFSNLPLLSLNRLKLVCKKWHYLIAHEILCKRKSFIQTCLFFTENHWSDSRLVSSRRDLITIISRQTFASIIRSELDNLEKDPHMIILFLNKYQNDFYVNSIDETPGLSSRKRQRREDLKHLSESFYDFLPKLVQKFEIKADGLIGTDLNNKFTHELESHFPYSSFAGLLIPKSDFFKFSIKNVAPKENLNELNNNARKLYEWLNLNYENDKLRFCFILPTVSCLGHRSFLNSIVAKLNQLKNEEEENFSISGGVVNGLSDESKLSIILLTENHLNSEPMVRVSQIVVPDLPRDLLEQIWSEKVRLLKENSDHLFKNQNLRHIALQVSCVARGEDYFGEENFESGLFRKSFPGIPVVGFFGQGEYGHDSLAGGENRSFMQRQYFFSNLTDFSFTTVFTIISIKV